MVTPGPTPLTPESEALLAHASIRARFLNDVTMGKPRPGSIPWLRDELIAIEAAVTARVLADVEALGDRLRYASRTLHATDPEHTREWEDCGWGDCVKDREALAHLTEGSPR